MFASGNPSGLLGGSICHLSCIDETIKKLSEIFHIINHADFEASVDNTQIFDNTGALTSRAGAIDSMAASARQIRLGLKVIW